MRHEHKLLGKKVYESGEPKKQLRGNDVGIYVLKDE